MTANHTLSAPSQTLSVREMAVAARRAGRTLGVLPTEQKNAALLEVAASLRQRSAEILSANAEDVAAARASGLGAALLDRLTLTPARLEGIAADVEHVVTLPDPVGQMLDRAERPNGLQVMKRRVPLGVLGVIYEARPNVTVDVAVLALKSGNAVILRGGRETVRSNAVLVDVIGSAIAAHGIPAASVQVIADPDRARMLELLKLDDLVDAIIPRGGAGLHRYCVENATVPVIVGGVGVVQLYVDASYVQDEQGRPDAEGVQNAAEIVFNSKVQRPSACNALDTLLITSASAPALPGIVRPLLEAGVEVRADDASLLVLRSAGLDVLPAAEADYGTEFLALILSVKTVANLDEALDFIAQYGGHTDAILTRDETQVQTFVQNVDSAAVIVNASTRFNDGAQLGLGAEVAVSTQKLHARGPMALQELTTTKWVVLGTGQIRD
ncbi:glutamate-5-semialdehyde dehydrogenase [Deinococcus sp. KNUC1210]|uniref:glutamate-5-semialdehyde dehydrogenase n=1 Tax=Deinococcus sp. KNUC1210 TaxID=2917691 RepID=UPI001EF011EB|nr:glutamate-5-semialdehyde dehydrogenase [Deinococcus sp. KNUC1210]ULH15393.1 glutamate-5-semialdehyde dehydrogenase [Deinococcus sp. KNUC1210]